MNRETALRIARQLAENNPGVAVVLRSDAGTVKQTAQDKDA